MSRYDFWTHGVDTVVEFPQRTTKIQHAGWGTLVRQQANTENWFHIPIPTPTVLANDFSVSLKYIRLRAEVNENATIDLVHFRDDGKLIHSETASLTNQTVDQRFDNPDREIEGGLTICIHVSFLTGTPLGQVVFRGAGARFE